MDDRHGDREPATGKSIVGGIVAMLLLGGVILLFVSPQAAGGVLRLASLLAKVL